MVQVLDWLNENELRAYPLLENVDRLLSSGLALPDNFIVDLLLVLPAKFNSSYIILRKIEISSIGDLSIFFGTDSEDIEVFEIIAPVAQVYPLYIRNPSGSLAVFGKGVMSVISAHPNGTDLTANIPVEPASCVEFFGAWLGVSSISTAPEKETKKPGNTPRLPLKSVDDYSLITGDVSFIPGYNFKVSISENLINLELGAGYGIKSTCRTSFLPQEYLDCSEVVSYINGIPPDSSGNFKLTAGVNISIIAGETLVDFNDIYSERANSNTIFLGFSFQDTDVCNTLNLTPALL